MREFFGYCFTWACCPLDNAVCCDDQQHCCPHDLPVCDTAAGRCLKGDNSLESVEWSTKVPAMKVCPLLSIVTKAASVPCQRGDIDINGACYLWRPCKGLPLRLYVVPVALTLLTLVQTLSGRTWLPQFAEEAATGEEDIVVVS